jgi:hypothetical protein
MADEELYQNVPTGPVHGEQQEIEQQQASAPLPEEGTVSEVEEVEEIVPNAPPEALQPQPEEEQNIRGVAFNPRTANFPPFGDTIDAAGIGINNEVALAIALLGRPNTTALTRRLAMSLMEEAGGLNPSPFGGDMLNPVDFETLGKPPEEIAESAGIEQET